MIVQPASIDPRSPRRRRLRAVGLALPVVLLVTVVAVALAGPEPSVVPPATERPAVAGAATAGPAETPGSSPSPDAADARVLFPRRLAGTDVHGVTWTLEARSRGLIRGGTVAVAGYLSLDPWPAGCAGASAEEAETPACNRTGVLSEEPWSGFSSGEPALPPFHLHPQFPDGLRVPVAVGSDVRWAGTATPVVLLVRFDDPHADPCVPGGRHCGQELVVERIAWVDGVAYPRGIADGGGPSTRGPRPSDAAPDPGQLP